VYDPLLRLLVTTTTMPPKSKTAPAGGEGVRQRRAASDASASTALAAAAAVAAEPEAAASAAASSPPSPSSSSSTATDLDDLLGALTLLLIVRLVLLSPSGVPSPSTLAARLLGERVLGAEFVARVAAQPQARFRYDVISDCDETFNYWEPTHYLLYGRGLQTWEYAPEFALRSYGYLLVHAALALAAGAAWGADKVQVFMRSRMLLALLCCACEAAFCVGVARRFGRRVALYTLVGLVASAGMLNAAPAFLPSSFTMCGLMLCWGAWLHGSRPAAMAAAGAVGLAFGWPFALVALAPMALHVAAREAHTLPRVLAAGGAAAALSFALQARVDRVLFGRWMLAQWNLFKYNALGVGGGGEGSNLYGVEPASFFAVNLLLNFNVLAVLALLSPLALLALWRGRRALEAKQRADEAARAALAAAGEAREAEQLQELARADDDDLLHAGEPVFTTLLACLAQLWLWFAVMSARPHKEERFMFVVFPLVPLAAAVTLVAIENLAVAPLAGWLFAAARSASTTSAAAASKPSEPLRRLERASLARALVAGLVFLAAGAASLSRVAALVYGFRAPVHVWEVLGHAIQAHKPGVENRDNLDAPQAPLLAAPRPWLGLDVVVTENGTLVSGGTDYTPSVPPGNEPLVRFSNPGVVVCVGKEWYRFPSHFFLPESTRANAAKFPHPDRRHRAGGPAQLGFLRSGFGGQMPQAYRMRAGGSAEANRSGFNDANKAWADYPYKSADVCDFIVDLQLPAGRTRQPELERHMAALPPIKAGSSFEQVEKLCHPPEEREPPPNCCGADAKSSNRFESVFCEPFLDRETSPLLARAFWVPGYSPSVASFGAYHILQRINCCEDGGSGSASGARH